MSVSVCLALFQSLCVVRVYAPVRTRVRVCILEQCVSLCVYQFIVCVCVCVCARARARACVCVCEGAKTHTVYYPREEGKLGQFYSV